MRIHDELSEARAQIARAMLEKERQFAGGRGDARWIHLCIVRAREALERAEQLARGERAAARPEFKAELPERRTGLATGCRLCDLGYRPCPSSVLDAMVHSDAPGRRTLCTNPTARNAWREGPARRESGGAA